MASKAIGFLNFKFSADLTAFERAMKKAQKNLKKFGKNLKKTGKSLTMNLTLPLVGLGVASVKAFDAQQKAIAQVEAGLKSTGNMVGFTSKQLQEMAAELQKISLFGDEDILQNVTAQLLTFTNIAQEQFEKTQVVAMDLATRVFDGNLKSASLMLGKALNDPVANLSALSRAGIQFSEDQKILIKSLAETGRMAEAQNVILAELERQYGGSAKAARDAGTGPLEVLMNQLSDLSEQIGERLIPHVQKFSEFIVGLAEKFDGLSESQKDNIVKWGLILAAVGPVLIILGTLTIAIGALMTPIGLATLAIGSLTTAIIYFKTSASNVAIDVRNNFATMSNSIISNVNIAIAAMNMLGAGMDLIPMTALEKKSSTTAASGSGFSKAIKGAITKYKAFLENLKNDSDGGGIGEPGAGLEKTVEQMEALSLATNDTFEEISLLSHRLDGLEMPENLFNTDPMDKYRGALGMLGDEIAAFAGTDIKSLEEGLASIMERMGDELAQGADTFQEYADNVKGMIKEVIGALISQGVAAAVSKSLISAGIINPFLIPVVAGLAAGLARTAFNSLIPSFADGGIVSGPTVGLMGEYPGASSNPEVIAPLDKLKSMIGGGSQNIIVEGVLKGNDIYLSNRNTSINRLRTT